MDTDTPPICQRVQAPSPAPRDLNHRGIGSYRLESMAMDACHNPSPPHWAPTELDRTFYLDIMERIVRDAVHWLDADGTVIDPVDGAEHAHTSPRFVAPAAVLMAFGRCRDLAEPTFRCMDRCCRRISTGKAEAADFWTRELITAWWCLEPIAPANRIEQWRTALSGFAPEQVYTGVRPDGHGLEELNNWTVYGAAGEAMRQAAGLGPPASGELWGDAFFDKYMPAQFTHVTTDGMYRDPNDPFTYDITTRLQMACALAFGYRGALHDDVAEVLRRGALTQLLYLSPEGYVPYGGRSGQFQFQEAIISALCELEARRYADVDASVAGAFRRQAHLSARSVQRWLLDMTPFRHIKNGFDPKLSHGIDIYGKYSGYGLLAASFFGLAAIFADDDIRETPCPAEGGAHLVDFPDAFHKVLCTVRDTQIEIDTRADLHYECTGLGRFSRTGVPLELGPGMSLTCTPSYLLAEEYRPGRNMAIGPEWTSPQIGEWLRLADFSDGLTTELTDKSVGSDKVAFTLRTRHEAHDFCVTESYCLTSGKLAYRCTIEQDGKAVPKMRLVVPLLKTDGAVRAEHKQGNAAVSVEYRGATLKIQPTAPASMRIDPLPVGNRNGLYRTLVIAVTGNVAGVELTLRRRES